MANRRSRCLRQKSAFSENFMCDLDLWHQNQIIPNCSGVTECGVTRCGNWWCHFFTSKSDDLFLTLLLVLLKSDKMITYWHWHPPLRLSTWWFVQCSSKFIRIKYLDFHYGVTPWMVSPGAARPPHSDATAAKLHRNCKCGKIPTRDAYTISC